MKDKTRPPRDHLVRSVADVEVRDSGESDASPTLTGHFAVFDTFTEIRSAFEGHFLERVAPGAFSKTFKERTPKVTLNHGADPELADKPLGRVETLREDEQGAYYEVALYRGIPELVMEGLKDGAYGASFRFRVIKEELVQDPEASDHNPQALPERTITEAAVEEFGPVTFPAYEGATAGVRSLTDDVFMAELASDSEKRERFRRMLEEESASDDEPDDDDDLSTPAKRDDDDKPGDDSADDTTSSEDDSPEDTAATDALPEAEAEPHSDDGSRADRNPGGYRLPRDSERKWRLP